MSVPQTTRVHSQSSGNMLNGNVLVEASLALAREFTCSFRASKRPDGGKLGVDLFPSCWLHLDLRRQQRHSTAASVLVRPPVCPAPEFSIGQTDSTRTRPKPVMDAACCCASQNRTSAGLDPETGSLSSHISRPPAVAPQAEFTPAQLFHNACTARRGQFHANACADGYFLSVRTPAGLLLPPANLSLRAAPRPREQRSRPGFLRCLRWAQSSGRTAERPFGCTVTTCSIQQRPNAAPSTLVQSAHAGTSLSRAGCLFQGKPACRVPAPAGPNRQPAAQFSTPGDEPGVRRLQPGNR